jgi:transcription elongation GreA/GreB family factor
MPRGNSGRSQRRTPGGGLSASARDRLEHELAALRARRDRFAAEVRARDPVGDQADNADALRLDDDIAALDDRIAELSKLLSGGGTRESRSWGVPDGTTVTLRFGDGEVETLQVVAVTEEIPSGQEDSTVTADSPLGLALVGHHSGDTIRYPAPAGEVEAHIISLEPPAPRQNPR